MTRRFVHLILVAACAGFMACSSPPAEEASDTGSEATEDQATDVPEEIPEAGDDVGKGFLPKDCLEIAQAMAGAAGGAMTGNAEVDFDKAIDGLRHAADAAPAELRGDFEVFGDAMARYFELLRDAGIDFKDPSSFGTPEAQKAVQKGAAILDDPEVERARQNIDKGMKGLCKG